MGAFSRLVPAPSTNGVCGDSHDNGGSTVAHYRLRNGGLRAARKRGQTTEPSSEEGQRTVHCVGVITVYALWCYVCHTLICMWMCLVGGASVMPIPS